MIHTLTHIPAASCGLQVLWSTEATGQLWNTCVWDLYSGTVEHTFKGGVSSANSLCLVGNEYLLSAECGKPLLHHWPICKKVCLSSLLLSDVFVVGSFIDIVIKSHFKVNL